MNCAMMKKLLIDYLERSLAAGKRNAVEHHLSQCDHCRNELSQLERLKKNLVSLEVPEPGADFWEHFNAKLSHRLAAEEAPAASHGSRLRTIAGRPMHALAAAAMAILLVAVLAIAALMIAPDSAKRDVTIPDIVLDSNGLRAVDIESGDVEFFLKNGNNGSELVIPDLSDEEMRYLEDEVFALIDPNLESVTGEMVPDNIYEETVYDLLDELAYDEIEQVYKELGLT